MSDQQLLLPIAQAASLTGLAVRTIWRLVSSGRFPQPIRIGRATRWRRFDIEEWIVGLRPGQQIEVNQG